MMKSLCVQQNRNLVMSIFFLLLLLPSLQAQRLYLIRYDGSGEPSDVYHRIVFFNESATPVNIGGYIVATRSYIIRIPDGTTIAPMSNFSMGRISMNENLDIAYLDGVEDFNVRVSPYQEVGDFVLLLNTNQRIVDAFYFGPKADVSFLPAREKLIASNRKEISVFIPDESNPVWKYLSIEPDVNQSFLLLDNKWEVNPRRNIKFPRSTAYRDFEASFIEGVVVLSWKTDFEKDCFMHIIERSLDDKVFEVVEQIPAKTNSAVVSTYKYYDELAENNQKYFYRIRTTDKFGKNTYSESNQVITQAGYGRLSMDLITRVQAEGKSLDIRFNADESQQVRVKILDEEFREVDVLFYGEVQAKKQHLIKYRSLLPIGKYYLIADTQGEREYIEFIIGKDREVIIQ